MNLKPLTYGYSNLTNFKGRDTRSQFWPFALVNFLISMLLWMPIFMWQFMSSMQEMREFAAANPDRATVSSGPGNYSVTIHDPPPGIGIDWVGVVVPMLVIEVIFVALVAAAVARRLHDIGRSGWLGAVPAVLLFVAGTTMAVVFGDIFEDGSDAAMLPFFAVFLLNMAYNISLIVLIVMLCLPSKPEENRYGPPPGS